MGCSLNRLARLLFVFSSALVLVFGSVTLAAAAGRVTGRVVDVDSKGPIDGARVLLVHVESGTPLVTQTDAEGRFTFDVVEPGRYRAQAMKPGLNTVAEVSVDANVVLTANESVATRDLGLRRGGVVSGRVVNAQGTPLAELIVQLEAADGGGRSTFVPPVQTNERGEFRITSLPPGEFVLVVRSRPGLAGESGAATGFLATYYPATADRARATALTISAGQANSPLEIVMQSGALYTVSGFVIDEDFLVVPNVTITLLPTAGTGSAVVGHGTDKGRFTIRGVQPGTYQLLPVRDTQDAQPGNAAAPSITQSATPAAALASDISITVDDRDLGGLTVVMGARPHLAAPH